MGKAFTITTVLGKTLTMRYRVFNPVYPQGDMYYDSLDDAQAYQRNVRDSLGIPMQIDTLTD